MSAIASLFGISEKLYPFPRIRPPIDLMSFSNDLSFDTAEGSLILGTTK